MSRLIKFVFFTITAILFSAAASFADTGAVGIKLNGVDIVNDSSPVVVDGRTLVPARAVFEDSEDSETDNNAAGSGEEDYSGGSNQETASPSRGSAGRDKETGTAAENVPDYISEEDLAILNQYGLSPVLEEVRHKLVVIDPGHGGNDPGALGYENRKVVLKEKDVNLDIALRVKRMLEAAGVSLYMIRTGDVAVPLYDRQDTANSLRASLYVSIHNNSNPSSSPHGTEVHYHGQNDPPRDGISAMVLAENLQKTLASNLGLQNRGTKVSPSLAVLRRTAMPAVIIEGAFMSNPNDLKYMKNDEFREKYAVSVAKCVIEALNNSSDYLDILAVNSTPIS
jgi:N-acetylmuramoyl-L-alanine amidase